MPPRNGSRDPPEKMEPAPEAGHQADPDPELDASPGELKAVIQELRADNARLQEKVQQLEAVHDDGSSVLESSELAILFLDPELRIQRFNQASAQLWRLVDADVGRSVSELVPSIGEQSLLEDCRSVLRDQTVRQAIVQTPEERHYLRRIRPYRTTDRRVAGLLVTLADVTALREKERLAHLRERQQTAIAELGNLALSGVALQELLDLAVALVAERMGVEYVLVLELLPNGRELLVRAGVGWKAGVVGSVRVDVSPHSQAGCTMRWGKALITQDLGRETFEDPPLLHDHGVVSGATVLIGHPRAPWGVLGIHSSGPMRLSPDQVLFLESVANVLAMAINRSCVEAELRESTRAQGESRERLELALEAGKMGAWDWDIANDHLTWSAEHYRLLGYEVGQVKPEYGLWRRHVHPEDGERIEEELRRSLEEASAFQSQYRIVRADGEVRWVEGRGRPIADSKGRVRHMYGVCSDITERHTTEAKLLLADQRKTAFLATLGHELRNPLAAVSSALQALCLPEADGNAQRQLREMMTHQVAQMTSLLNDLLDVSRISRGAIELKRRRLRIGGPTRNAVAALEPEARKGRQRVILDLGSEDLVVAADPVRLEQIVVNLLGNAIRYSDPGSEILVQARCAGDEIRLAVRDFGIGLTEDELGKVFEPFFQGRKGSGGLGIGLSLAQQLTALHGGRLEGHSEGPGQGSTFTVVLPAAGAPAESEEPIVARPRAASLEHLCVLIVDDHADSAETLAQLLSRYCRTLVAVNGRTAQFLAESRRPSVVLLDVGLPDVSGIQVARNLRAGADTADIGLVALTGFGDAETAEEIRAVGFDEHLLKPVELPRLLEVLGRFAER